MLIPKIHYRKIAEFFGTIFVKIVGSNRIKELSDNFYWYYCFITCSVIF